jgi:hypothetical protein
LPVCRVWPSKGQAGVAKATAYSLPLSRVGFTQSSLRTVHSSGPNTEKIRLTLVPYHSSAKAFCRIRRPFTTMGPSGLPKPPGPNAKDCLGLQISKSNQKLPKTPYDFYLVLAWPVCRVWPRRCQAGVAIATTYFLPLALVGSTQSSLRMVHSSGHNTEKIRLTVDHTTPALRHSAEFEGQSRPWDLVACQGHPVPTQKTAWVSRSRRVTKSYQKPHTIFSWC